VVHAYGTGVAAYLTELVRSRLSLRARFLRPDLISRAMSSCVAKTDRSEALWVGQQAVAHLSDGWTDYMVTLERTDNEPYRCETGLASLAEVANAEKMLPREFVNEAGTMVTDAFKVYAWPLIDGPLSPLARLLGNRVPKRAIGV
jgi:6-phosphofructokinase 1